MVGETESQSPPSLDATAVDETYHGSKAKENNSSADKLKKEQPLFYPFLKRQHPRHSKPRCVNKAGKMVPSLPYKQWLPPILHQLYCRVMCEGPFGKFLSLHHILSQSKQTRVILFVSVYFSRNSSCSKRHYQLSVSSNSHLSHDNYCWFEMIWFVVSTCQQHINTLINS